MRRGSCATKPLPQSQQQGTAASRTGFRRHSDVALQSCKQRMRLQRVLTAGGVEKLGTRIRCQGQRLDQLDAAAGQLLLQAGRQQPRRSWQCQQLLQPCEVRYTHEPRWQLNRILSGRFEQSASFDSGCFTRDLTDVPAMCVPDAAMLPPLAPSLAAAAAPEMVGSTMPASTGKSSFRMQCARYAQFTTKSAAVHGLAGSRCSHSVVLIQTPHP